MRKALVRMVVAVLAIVMVYTPVYATTTYTSSTKAYYSASKLKRNFGSRTNPKKGIKPVSVPKPAVNGCIYGDFATFNSLASENKLGGTPIYICGTIKSVEKLASTGDIFYGAFMVDDCDGYQWCATMDIPSANFDLVKATYTGKTGYVFGLYNGYSTDMSRPLLDIATIVDATGQPTQPVTSVASTVTLVGQSSDISNPIATAEAPAQIDAPSIESTININTNNVWIPTKTGKKYHINPACSNMKNPRQVTLQEAISKGYAACEDCVN